MKRQKIDCVKYIHKIYINHDQVNTVHIVQVYCTTVNVIELNLTLIIMQLDQYLCIKIDLLKYVPFVKLVGTMHIEGK